MSNVQTKTLVRTSVGLGIAMMFLGDFLFAANDVLGKWLVGTYSVGQVLLLRSAAGLLFILPMAWRSGRSALFDLERPRIQILRVVLATIELAAFYAAASYLPVADVMTFYLAGPIYVAALSPWLLGESVSRQQWVAILVGFVGVVIALEPSSQSLSVPSLISIGGSFAFALTVVQSRQLRRTPDITLVFWQTLGALALGCVMAPFQWVPPTPFHFALLGFLGIVAMTAHLCINRALKLAPAAVVAPIQYTLLLWAVIFGYFVFDTVPKPMMLVGAAIIIASGVFLFFSQRSDAAKERLKHEARAEDFDMV